MTTTPAGWYPDPTAPGTVRWWDGTTWTEHRQAMPPQAAPATPERPAGPPPTTGSQPAVPPPGTAPGGAGATGAGTPPQPPGPPPRPGATPAWGAPAGAPPPGWPAGAPAGQPPGGGTNTTLVAVLIGVVVVAALAVGGVLVWRSRTPQVVTPDQFASAVCIRVEPSMERLATESERLADFEPTSASDIARELVPYLRSIATLFRDMSAALADAGTPDVPEGAQQVAAARSTLDTAAANIDRLAGEIAAIDPNAADAEQQMLGALAALPDAFTETDSPFPEGGPLGTAFDTAEPCRRIDERFQTIQGG